MKKRIGIFLVCILLMAYTIPVIADSNVYIKSEDPNQSYRDKVKHLDDGRSPPDPGDMPEGFILPTQTNNQNNFNPPENFNFDHETIIEIIESINENLILGYLENLTAFGPRVTGTTAVEEAGDYIYGEFESYGLDVRYDPWSYYGYSGNNIEGTLEGIDPYSDYIYIICAHYDSVPGSPGADDDGSGVAAVMAAAKIMSEYEFNHTIRFVTFDGEEQGLLGSHEYANEASQNGDNIAGVLNGDMIGYAENPTQASYIKIYENTASEWLTDKTDDVSQNYYDYIELTIVPSGYASNSDHASFWSYGFDAIMYHEYEFNQYYHSPQDIIANMDIDYSTRVSRLMIATLGELAECQISNIPPSNPIITGPSSGYEGEELTFSVSATDPEGYGIFYFFDWGDGTTSEWLGPYASGETAEISHTFYNIGEYEIKAKAKDINNSQSEWSDLYAITIIENLPPESPTISGQKIGMTGKELEFKFRAVDPEGYDIYYYISWGDGVSEYWLGPYPSGEEVTFTHTYTEGGSFNIISKAQDMFGKEGPQRQISLFIIKNRARSRPILFQILERLLNLFPRLENLLGF